MVKPEDVGVDTFGECWSMSCVLWGCHTNDHRRLGKERWVIISEFR